MQQCTEASWFPPHHCVAPTLHQTPTCHLDPKKGRWAQFAVLASSCNGYCMCHAVVARTGNIQSTAKGQYVILVTPQLPPIAWYLGCSSHPWLPTSSATGSVDSVIWWLLFICPLYLAMNCTFLWFSGK